MSRIAPVQAPAMGPLAVASLVATVAAAFCLLLVGPGLCWRGGRAHADALLLDLAWSVVAVTVVGLALAAFDVFSLPRLLIVAAAVTAVGALRAVLVSVDSQAGPTRGLRRPWSAGPVLAVVAIAFAWPPYETHVAGTDSTGYLSAGSYLARSGSLSRIDPLLDELPQELRRALFRPALGGPDKPPYVRHPGGTHLASTEAADTRVRPNFFPAPMLWAAVFSAVASPRYAGGYATLFAALSLWALWAFARRRMSGASAMAVAALAGLNLAGYWSARFALSEPLAGFLLWSGLVALDVWEDYGDCADALSAGVLLGAVGLVRVDYSVFVLVALLVRRSLAGTPETDALPRAFYLGFAALLAATVAEIVLIPGGYVLPLTETWDGLSARVAALWSDGPVLVVAAAGVAVALGMVLMARLGLVPAVCVSAVATYLIGYTVFASQPQPMRSIRWLVEGLGAPLLLFASFGAVVLWRGRCAPRRRANDRFLLLLAFSVGFVLVYNPHVQPFLLWALRRFVPVVIPALLVLAALAAESVRRRWRWVGLGAWLLLVATVLWPAHALWGKPLYRGAYDQLASFDQRIAERAALLVDMRLASYMPGTPLWLLYDRDCITLDLSTARGREVAAATAARLTTSRPVYVAIPQGRPPADLPGFAPPSAQEPASRFSFELLFPDQTDRLGVVRTRKHTMPVALYELHPAPRSTDQATVQP